MPVLAAFIATLATWVVENIFIGLAAWFTRRTLATAAFWSLVTAAILTFFVAVKALIAGLGAVMPAWFAVAVTWVFPNNLPYLITFYVSVRVAGVAFRYSRDIITASVRGPGGDSKAIWG